MAWLLIFTLFGVPNFPEDDTSVTGPTFATEARCEQYLAAWVADGPWRAEWMPACIEIVKDN